MQVRIEGDTLHRYFVALGHNTLFGFQYDTGIQPEHFCICWCDDDLPDAIVAQVRQTSGADSLRLGDYLGRGYLTIHRRDVDKNVRIFDALLAAGTWFRTRNDADVYFGPLERDVSFSAEKMEEKFINSTNKMLEQYPHFISMETVIKRSAYKPWSYFTERGKTFCAALRALKHKKPVLRKMSGNLFIWPQFADVIYMPCYLFPVLKDQAPIEAAQAAAFAEQPPLEPMVVEEEEEEDLCMICMDAKPNTQVHPCGHVVVCSMCSHGLKNTHDAHTCVKCRRPIISVSDI